MRKYKSLNINLFIVVSMVTVLFFASFAFADAREYPTIKAKSAEKVDTQRTRPQGLVEEEGDDKLKAGVTTQNRKADIKVNTQNERNEQKAERKERLTEKARNRVEAYVERITKRLNAALDRMEEMAERVESRIAKLEEKFTDKDLDLSESKDLLEKARTEIESARRAVSSIEVSISGVLNTDNPRESFTTVKELTRSAIVNIKNAHRALVEAIKSVKASVGTIKPDSTNTINDNE